MCVRRALVLATLSITLPAAAAWHSASAQTAATLPANCDSKTADSLHGAIRGRILNDSTGKPIGGRGVFLIATRCFAATDDSGNFVFDGVPLGAYKLSVAPLFYRRMQPVPVTVNSRDTADIEIRMKPENRIADCLDLPDCATFLNRDPTGVRLSGDAEIRELLMRTNVALLLAEDWQLGRFVVCLSESDPQILAALRESVQKIAPARDCALKPTDRFRSEGRLVHVPTGEPAVSLSIGRIQYDGEEMTAGLSSYVAPLWGAGWVCQFKREGTKWRPNTCRMTWVS
jgi:hypothetical protein